MRILICTGIYPPHTGGPAQYAKEIEEELKRQGHTVKVLTYGKVERALPIIIRHEYFFWKVLLNIRKVDLILALDTFSVAWPSVFAAKITGKKIIVRAGGDFLWEAYVERTGDLVLFKNFYETRKNRFSYKEKLIYSVTKWVLKNTSAIAFTTKWQKDIFEKEYNLDSAKNKIIENYYGERLERNIPTAKIFVAGSRNLKLKNIDRLNRAFSDIKKIDNSLFLDAEKVSHEKFMDKIKNGYAVILVSISEISPNGILDAIRFNTPFILTRETGLYDKLKDIGIFVDPENEEEIEKSILFLSSEENYKRQQEKIASFTFTHSWSDICKEIIDLSKTI